MDHKVDVSPEAGSDTLAKLEVVEFLMSCSDIDSRSLGKDLDTVGILLAE